MPHKLCLSSTLHRLFSKIKELGGERGETFPSLLLKGEKKMEEDGRKYGSVRVTDSQVISSVPCDLLQVIVTHTTGTSKWQVYDGVDTGGDIKLDMKTPYTKSFTFPGGMYMRRGIYFVRESGVHSALFRWRSIPRDKE